MCKLKNVLTLLNGSMRLRGVKMNQFLIIFLGVVLVFCLYEVVDTIGTTKRHNKEMQRRTQQFKNNVPWINREHAYIKRILGIDDEK